MPLAISPDIVRALLKPVVRFCVRHSFSLQDLIFAAKQAFIQVASEEMQQKKQNINLSRLSVMTGLHRAELKRMISNPDVNYEKPGSVLSRVITQWQVDRRFSNRRGKPLNLSFRGENNQFEQLVASVTTALNPGTVLFELKRSGYVEVVGAKLRLLEPISNFSQDPRSGFELVALGNDALTRAAEENLAGTEKVGNLHIHTHFDNLALSKIPETKEWLLQEGMLFQKKVREYLAERDKDINPELAKETGGGKVTVTTFSLAEDQ